MIPFKVTAPEEIAEQFAALKYGYKVPLQVATSVKEWCILIGQNPYFTNNAFQRLDQLILKGQSPYNPKPGEIVLINCKEYQNYLLNEDL